MSCLVENLCIQTTAETSRQVDDNDQIIILYETVIVAKLPILRQDLLSIYLPFLITMCDIHEIIF